MALKHAIASGIERLSPRLSRELRYLRRDRHIEPELWWCRHFCSKQSAALDVGANAGVYAAWLAKFARRVIAFEPNPAIADFLERTTPANVEVRRLALSQEAGSAELRFEPGNTGIGTIEAGNTFAHNDTIKQITSIRVPLVRLDENVVEPTSFIKIDVEGHEESVVAGAEGLLRAHKPALLIEIEERHNPGGHARLLDRLTSLGYRQFFCLDGLRPLDGIAVPAADAERYMARSGYSPNNFFFVHQDNAHAMSRAGARS